MQPFALKSGNWESGSAETTRLICDLRPRCSTTPPTVVEVPAIDGVFSQDDRLLRHGSRTYEEAKAYKSGMVELCCSDRVVALEGDEGGHFG